MSTLRQAIENQAVQFAEAIIHAFRSASIDELAGVHSGTRGAPSSRASKAVSGPAPKTVNDPGGRLGRRSSEDIAKVLESIVSLLGQHPEGLRAEQIKDSLGLDKREMPKPIGEGLKSGALTKTGAKRATTYFAGSASGKTRSAKRN